MKFTGVINQTTATSVPIRKSELWMLISISMTQREWLAVE